LFFYLLFFFLSSLLIVAAALSDPEWKAMHEVKPAVGFHVWRIEKFTVKKWPKEKFGQFFNGDAYIVLRTYKVDDKFKYDVHFWLGAMCSVDEAGTAAIKTVELDDALGQVPVQHREVQGILVLVLLCGCSTV
jgi:gelsolin